MKWLICSTLSQASSGSNPVQCTESMEDDKSFTSTANQNAAHTFIPVWLLSVPVRVCSSFDQAIDCSACKLSETWKNSHTSHILSQQQFDFIWSTLRINYQIFLLATPTKWFQNVLSCHLRLLRLPTHNLILYSRELKCNFWLFDLRKQLSTAALWGCVHTAMLTTAC